MSMEHTSTRNSIFLTEDSWREIRFWRRLFWFGWLLYIPVVGAIAYLFSGIGINGAQYIAIVWMAAWAFSGIRLQLCRCPHCNERFFSRGIGGSKWFRFHNIFAVKCLNCKVRIGTTGIENLSAINHTDSTCLSCGKPIPRDTDKCPSCGWTYKA